MAATSLGSGLGLLSDGTLLSPFSRLRALLANVEPEKTETIDLTLGEPRETMPAFASNALAEAGASLAKYPTIRGTEVLREAISAWAERRYGSAVQLDASREILPCNGSREGLLYACFAAVGRKASSVEQQPAVLMCNPYYQVYMGAAYAAGAEPVFLNATRKAGHLPDLDALAQDERLLKRTAALYVCSPANPQGAVATREYLKRALALARLYGFMLFVDECYSEIYNDMAPPGGLEAGAEGQFRNLLVFNSLSKRSNLPGLRSGFVAGDGDFLGSLAELRNLIGPQMPGPVQHVSALVWADEDHVIANRQAYRRKFDICDTVLGGRLGYERPAGGFFLWLDVSGFGGGERAAVTLWKRWGVKVIPGAFLGSADRDGVNPGTDYVRVALVQDEATISEALERIVEAAA